MTWYTNRALVCGWCLQKFIKSNETIHLTSRVDATLIGGMVVSIGDKYVDMSIASKIKKYTELISATA